ncbi:hypothetical protein H2202_004063 [Exophiala xenobiotica]|nr:hypothetical protein H2202_004063 [Exophiala xenobiotica]KAK5191086.1 hypothetical protein LTR92_008805 [Exophiala xenobiotica]
MAPSKEVTNILFVPYRQPSSNKAKLSATVGDDISPQKHAAREYHRKAKVTRQQAESSAQNKRHSRKKHQPSEGRPNAGSHPKKESVLEEEDQTKTLEVIDPGAGRLDPFNIVLPNNVPSYVMEMLDYGVSILQSGITLCLLHYPPVIPAEHTATSLHARPTSKSPSSTVSALGNLRDVVVSCALHSPASFYTIALAGATHRSYSTETSQNIKILRLHYAVQAVKALNHELQTLDGDPADALLFCISLLAAHASSGEQVSPPVKEQSKSPLATAQTQYYGSLRWEDAHMKAIRLLVERKGGIHKVKLPGIANVLGLADIFMSWLSLKSPAWPLLAPTSFVLSTWPAPPPTLTHTLLDMTAGFALLPKAMTSTALFDVLANVRTISIGYDMYLSQQPLAPSLVQILWARNSVTHDLLSLNTSLTSGDLAAAATRNSPELCSDERREAGMVLDVSEMQALYQVVRLSTLAYTLLVLFPMPRVAGVHATLAKQIMAAVKTCMALGLWERGMQGPQGLLLWATIMGGMVADENEPVREWFVNVLTRKNTLPCEEDMWEDMRGVVAQYLWFDGPECDGVGREVWMEVCEMDDQGGG